MYVYIRDWEYQWEPHCEPDTGQEGVPPVSPCSEDRCILAEVGKHYNQQLKVSILIVTYVV